MVVRTCVRNAFSGTDAPSEVNRLPQSSSTADPVRAMTVVTGACAVSCPLGALVMSSATRIPKNDVRFIVCVLPIALSARTQIAGGIVRGRLRKDSCVVRGFFFWLPLPAEFRGEISALFFASDQSSKSKVLTGILERIVKVSRLRQTGRSNQGKPFVGGRYGGGLAASRCLDPDTRFC